MANILIEINAGYLWLKIIRCIRACDSNTDPFSKYPSYGYLMDCQLGLSQTEPELSVIQGRPAP